MHLSIAITAMDSSQSGQRSHAIESAKILTNPMEVVIVPVLEDNFSYLRAYVQGEYAPVRRFMSCCVICPCSNRH